MVPADEREERRDSAVRIHEKETSGPLVEAFLAGESPCPAFLGVSIKNKMANRRTLCEAIPWLSWHASAALVVIGDYPHRHNLVALRGFSPHGALKKAIADGSRALKTARDIARDIGNGNPVVCSAADLIETVECRSVLQSLSAYFNQGGGFVKDVLQAALSYAAHARPDLPRSHATQVLPILKDYMLEEVAMFLHLHHLGYAVEVYLGADLPIMKNIALGRYPGFPYACPERTHVSIQVEHVRAKESN